LAIQFENSIWAVTRGSRRLKRKAERARRELAMLDPVCQDTQRERLDPTEGLLASRPVDHDSGKVRHLAMGLAHALSKRWRRDDPVQAGFAERILVQV
jgi:hypothetical protein